MLAPIHSCSTYLSLSRSLQIPPHPAFIRAPKHLLNLFAPPFRQLEIRIPSVTLCESLVQPRNIPRCWRQVLKVIRPLHILHLPSRVLLYLDRRPGIHGLNDGFRAGDADLAFRADDVPDQSRGGLEGLPATEGDAQRGVLGAFQRAVDGQEVRHVGGHGFFDLSRRGRDGNLLLRDGAVRVEGGELAEDEVHVVDHVGVCDRDGVPADFAVDEVGKPLAELVGIAHPGDGGDGAAEHGPDAVCGQEGLDTADYGGHAALEADDSADGVLLGQGMKLRGLGKGGCERPFYEDVFSGEDGRFDGRVVGVDSDGADYKVDVRVSGDVFWVSVGFGRRIEVECFDGSLGRVHAGVTECFDHIFVRECLEVGEMGGRRPG